MLEYPEVVTISRQLNETVVGKKIKAVFPPTKLHKFTWFNGDPVLYNKQLQGSTVQSASGFGIFVEITFSNGKKLCFNDGIHPLFCKDNRIDESSSKNNKLNYQLLIQFEDDSSLMFTVGMYGGLFLHDGDYDNEYYIKSRNSFIPGSTEFTESFNKQLVELKPSLSAKAFLATDQHFPGIGNGVIQDILFDACISPKKKLSALSDTQKKQLLTSTLTILTQMAQAGGRDTETDLFGNSGKYVSKLSKNTYKAPCPKCGGIITKEAYLGGSVYYCPNCQK